MSKNRNIRDFNDFALFDLRSNLYNNEIINVRELNDRLKCSGRIHFNQGRRGSHHIPSDVNGKGIHTSKMGEKNNV